MKPSSQWNPTIVQGNTFRYTLTITNPNSDDPTGRTPGTAVDLTGCSAVMNFFLSGPSDTIIYSINSTTPTTNGGLITLGGTAGTVALYIPPLDTNTITPCSYSLVITFTNGDVYTFLSSTINIFEAL